MWCENGRPLPRLAQYYRRRVEGGVGLVITESCAVDHPSSTQTPMFARITEATLDAWADCVAAVQGAGGRIFVQLWHEGAVRKEGGDGSIRSIEASVPRGWCTAASPMAWQPAWGI